MKRMICALASFISLLANPLIASASEPPVPALELLERSCFDCHNKELNEGGLDLTALSFTLSDQGVRERWVRIHDRVKKGEMPPQGEELSKESRAVLVTSLQEAIHAADLAEIRAEGRGPMRRLNRDEYEQNLRDLLKLPQLDNLMETRVTITYNICLHADKDGRRQVISC